MKKKLLTLIARRKNKQTIRFFQIRFFCSSMKQSKWHCLLGNAKETQTNTLGVIMIVIGWARINKMYRKPVTFLIRNYSNIISRFCSYRIFLGSSWVRQFNFDRKSAAIIIFLRMWKKCGAVFFWADLMASGFENNRNMTLDVYEILRDCVCSVNWCDLFAHLWYAKTKEHFVFEFRMTLINFYPLSQ